MKHCETIWREALSDLPSSGLSLRKYCQERHLNYARTRYWCHRLASSPEESSLTFAVVQLPNSDQSQDSGVAVECGRYCVRLSNRFDESVLLRIVALLSAGENWMTFTIVT